MRPYKCGYCDYIEASYIGYICGHPVIKETIQIYEKKTGQKHSLRNIKVSADGRPPDNCPIPYK